MRKYNLFIVLVLFSGNLFAQVQLPALFSDNMVLQQQFEVPFWGWANAGEIVVVTGSWNNTAKETVTEPNGKWELELQTPKAGGPYFVTINNDTLHNVMIGEVWICSGQSNMQWALDQSMDSEEEIPNANFPGIRFFYLARQLSDEPQKDCHAYWTACKPETAKDFSAVAYYFGKQLHQDLNVPVGLIHTSWGGSSAQAWVSEEVLKSDPDYAIYYEKQQKAEEKAKRGTLTINQQSPNCLYNAMIAPLIPFGIRGAIWYQGESNTGNAKLYEKLFPRMITNWRNDWGQGDFPFYFVQLAPYEYDTPLVGAKLRDAQRKSLKVPKTGMAVIMDIGDPDNIHPVNKHDVGHRLALWALAKDYGKSDLVFSGPLYKSKQVEDRKIRLLFDYVESGLVSTGGKLTQFEIAGNDQEFYPAKAKIENETIVVSARKVSNPVAVRFAFHNADEPNLFNKEGLPASSFRTDDWPIITESVRISNEYNPENKTFTISLRAPGNCKIYYTINAGEPDSKSNYYTNPFILKNTTSIKARAYVDDMPSIVTTEYHIIRHLATGKKVTYTNTYSGKFDAGGDLALVNGMKGSDHYNDGNWQGFRGKDVEAVIDLGETQTVNSIAAGFLQNQQSWILCPEKVEYYSSTDGIKFIKLGDVSNTIPKNEKETIKQEFKLDNLDDKHRYIKMRASKLTLPDWHSGAGSDAWFFIDEIVVE